MKVDIAICTHNRIGELCLLLQSLRTQTHQDFDIYIMDDRTPNGIVQYHNVMCLINRLKCEGHKVTVFNNDIRVGVSRLRKQLVEKILRYGDGELILSIDDDVIPQTDYIELLHHGIEEGYDVVSGLTPPIMQPEWIRPLDKVTPYVDNIELDKEGNLTRFDDNCGNVFDRKTLVPALHYRSGALFRTNVLEQCSFPENLGFCSFREEEYVAWQAHLKGFKFAIHTGAIIYHVMTPTGGNRNQEYQQNVANNVEHHKKYTKELFEKHGDFIQKAKEKIKDGKKV